MPRPLLCGDRTGCCPMFWPHFFASFFLSSSSFLVVCEYLHPLSQHLSLISSFGHISSPLGRTLSNAYTSSSSLLASSHPLWSSSLQFICSFIMFSCLSLTPPVTLNLYILIFSDKLFVSSTRKKYFSRKSSSESYLPLIRSCLNGSCDPDG